MTMAQSPNTLSYQAVVRDGSNNLVTSTAVGMQISILQGSTSGTAVFVETHSITSNANGLVSVEIGNGTNVSGNISTIDWSAGPYFLKTETDPNGGTSYTISGTTQLLSVPYALHANTVENDLDEQTLSISGQDLTISGGNTVTLPSGSGGGGKTHLILSGDITDAQAVTKIQNEVGPNTQFVQIINTTQLTTVDLSSLSELIELKVNNNDVLNSINISGLQHVYTEISFQNNSALPTINLGNLVTCPDGLTISYNDALTSIDLSGIMSTRSGFSISTNNILSSIDLTNLVTTGGTSSGSSLFITANPQLSTLTTPNLTNIHNQGGGFGLFSNALTSLDLSNVLDITATDLNIANNQLSSVVINLFLDRCVNSSTPIQAGTWLTMSNQTPAAPPTGQGITDAATLTGMSVTVTTD
jgi:hypothetical protein